MFTDCPSCERLFRIRADQLGAADGWVRCGYCAQTFYALERLHDAPVTQSARRRQPEETVPPPLVADIEPEPAPGQPAVDAPVQTPQEPGAPQQDFAQDETTETEEADEFLSGLRSAPVGASTNSTGSSVRIIWLGMIVLFSVLALAQLAWFNRDWMVRAYPTLAPWVHKICVRWQCEPIRFRDLSAIRLLNREVTLHPRYRNALQVRASLVNLAKFIQRYPDIELLIFSVDGEALARGRFRPEQYLNPDVDPAAGMPSHVPVDVTLELAGPAGEATNFHLRFH